MGEIVKQILTRPIQLADQISKSVEKAFLFQTECLQLQSKTKTLANLIRLLSRATLEGYERPTRLIIGETEQVLENALRLVNKCRTRSVLKRLFSIITNNAFRIMSSKLDDSIENMTFLLCVTTSGLKDDDDEDDFEYYVLPPIAQNEPILCIIWEQIGRLSSGSLKNRSDAADQLFSLALDNSRYRRLVIEEGGVGPLMKLAKEGNPDEQESAVRAIGYLGTYDEENVEQIMNADAATVFANILKDGQMNVQTVVAWAVSELAANCPKFQDHFAQKGVVAQLVGHLAHESPTTEEKIPIPAVDHNRNIDQHGLKGGSITAMAARALWHLSKGNISICRSMTESGALLSFAALLRNGDEEARYNSVMALMEITSMAKENMDTFKLNSSITKVVVEQFRKVITELTEENSSNLLIPCIKSLGNLTPFFEETETCVIDPLVKLLLMLLVQKTINYNTETKTDSSSTQRRCP